jgi:hypothetical protein
VNVLVLAPHGDDETLGCGGTIAKHVEQNDTVTVAFLRRSYDERTFLQLKNTADSKAILGYKFAEYININEQELVNNKVLLIKHLEDLFSKTKPDILYSTFYGDLHQDHRSLFEAVSSASRIRGPQYIKQIFLYECIPSTGQGLISTLTPFIPNYYNILDKHHIDKKINSLKCYITEYNDADHLRSEEHIFHYSRYRGREIKAKYAEAFVCMRYINE